MPLISHQGDSDPLVSGDKTLLVFYSSRDETGRMWCSDCRKVEGLIQKSFAESSEKGLVIYVGQKEIWKSSTNKYRQSHGIESIPTIVRFNDGKEEARLVDDEILQPGALEQFIRN